MQQQVYNPAYGGYIPPMQPSMQQHQPSFQQPSQQPLQQPAFGVPGRVVGSASEIKPDEVPTDGTIAWFPLSDGSGVISKKMLGDWTVDTEFYEKKEMPKEPSAAEVMMGKLDRILDAVTSDVSYGAHAHTEVEDA